MRRHGWKGGRLMLRRAENSCSSVCQYESFLLMIQSEELLSVKLEQPSTCKMDRTNSKSQIRELCSCMVTKNSCLLFSICSCSCFCNSSIVASSPQAAPAAPQTPDPDAPVAGFVRHTPARFLLFVFLPQHHQWTDWATATACVLCLFRVLYILQACCFEHFKLKFESTYKHASNIS